MRNSVIDHQSDDLQLSLILPCHNEAEALPTLLPRIARALSELERRGIASEVIVVDDGSTDGSIDHLSAYPSVQLIRHPVCRGYGSALKAGLEKSRGKYAVFFDLDNTYCPEDLGSFVETARSRNADVVMGYRPFFHSGMPWVRTLGNLLFVIFSRLMLGGGLRDLSTGYRLLRREVIPSVLKLESEGFNFSMHLSLFAMREKLTLHEIPIRYEERIGRSKLNALQDGVRFFELMLRHRWQKRGLR